mgnify:FL=1
MSTTIFEVEEHVAYIKLNRPESMNALNPELRYALSQHLDEVENNKNIWLAVISGEGDKAFCAGMDLKHRALLANATDEQITEWDRLQENTVPLNQRWEFPKPVIAKVNGFALGGGLELALACDIIVASENSEFGLPEPRRGLIAGGVGVHRLPRQIGLKPAMGYLLTGRHMSATRAFELGLVNEVVSAERLDEVVEEWVKDILLCSPMAVRATKQAAMRGLDTSLSQAFSNSYEYETARAESEDAIEGPLAFAEKRKPQWKGFD